MILWIELNWLGWGVMIWTEQVWKAKKVELERAIKERSNDLAKRIIDQIAEQLQENKELAEKQLYVEFKNDAGTFNDYPILATIFYGNLEIFNYIKAVLNLDLSKTISASHIKINVADVPCKKDGENKPDEERLQQANQILLVLDKELSWEQKRECKFFLLAVFFLNAEIVSRTIEDPRFAEVANEVGSRLARPINMAAGLYNNDPRNKKICDMLLLRDEVRADLKNNDTFFQNLLDGLQYELAGRLLDQNVIPKKQLEKTSTLSAMLARFLVVSDQESSSFSEDKLNNIRKLYSAMIAAQDPVMAVMYTSRNLINMPQNVKKIILEELVAKIRPVLVSGKSTLSYIMAECDPQFMIEVVGNPSFMVGLLDKVVLGISDRELLYGERGLARSQVPQNFDFESLSRMDFVPRDLKVRLKNTIDKLVAVEKPSNLEELNSEYYQALTDLFKLNQFTVQNMDNFRLSVERHLSDHGRVDRLKIAHDIHEQVMFDMKVIGRGEVLPYHGVDLNRVLARTLNVVNSITPSVIGSAVSSASSVLSTAMHNMILYGLGDQKPVVVDEVSKLKVNPPKKESDGHDLS